MALPHEFRLPLSIIHGYSQSLKTSASELDTHEIVSMADSIYESCLRLQRLTENFLLYSQIELWSIDPDRLRVLQGINTKDTDRVVRTWANTIASQYSRSIDLTLCLSKQRANICRKHLEKIVSELLDNAFKFSKPATPVSVVTTAIDGVFTLRIKDHGCGMTEEHVANIGALVQFDRNNQEQQGIGLGLAIATRLSELHGGSLQVCSKPEEGTIVTVNIPPYESRYNHSKPFNIIQQEDKMSYKPCCESLSWQS